VQRRPPTIENLEIRSLQDRDIEQIAEAFQTLGPKPREQYERYLRE
jgi:hypothetical protein